MTGAHRVTVLLNAGRQPGAPVFTRRQPTPVKDLQEASEADKQEDEEEPDIAAGEFVYGNRCAECHGEGAAGTDQAASLVGLTLSEDEFEDLIRTGGELGPRSPVRLYENQPGRTQCGLRLFNIARVNTFL